MTEETTDLQVDSPELVSHIVHAIVDAMQAQDEAAAELLWKALVLVSTP